MPTVQKTLMYSVSFLSGLGSFIVICAALATHRWISSTILISDASSNGSIFITYGLFRGESHQEFSQGLEEMTKHFAVLGLLAASVAKTLQTVVVLLLALGLAASGLGCVFCFYNAVSNPYQTFLGPPGVYTWSGLSASFVLVGMVLFAVNTQSSGVSEDLVQKLYPVYPTSSHKGVTHSYGLSFWLLLLALALDVVTTVVIAFYQRARSQQRQEQRKPVESAPRDGILF